MRSFLLEGEKIIMSTPGAIDIGTIDVQWRYGNLHITDKRVLFKRQDRIQFAAFLEDVVDVRLQMRKWVLQHTRQLCISHRDGQHGTLRVAYVALASPAVWQQAIKDRMTMALLDGRSRRHSGPQRIAPRHFGRSASPERREARGAE
ncbi:hypothetical protein ACFLXE_05815 [Chloroflexota bacterium]